MTIRILGTRKFASSTTLTLQQWTKGYQWAKADITIYAPVTFDNYGKYFCPSGVEKDFSDEDLINLQNMRWNTFDQFKKRAFKIYIIDVPKEKEDWVNSLCTCPSFFKQFMCKHVIGLAIRL